jgi:diguanylate cyclase (GGDEF)-like protein
MAVLLIDLDHFKDVNDTYGHLAGDMVLASLGSALKEGRRRDDVVGRWGGEEFAVGLPACPWSAAHRIAEEIRERVGIMEVDAGKHVIRITASIGLAVGTVTRQQLGMESIAGGATHLLALADQELYKAKARGRNRVSGIEWYLETEE